MDTIDTEAGYDLEHSAEQTDVSEVKRLGISEENTVKCDESGNLKLKAATDSEVYTDNIVNSSQQMSGANQNTPECNKKQTIETDHVSKHDFGTYLSSTTLENQSLEVNEETVDTKIDMNSEGSSVDKTEIKSKTGTVSKRSCKRFSKPLKKERFKLKLKKLIKLKIIEVRRKQIEKCQKNRKVFKRNTKSAKPVEVEQDEKGEGTSQTKIGDMGKLKTNSVRKETSQIRKPYRVCDRCGKILYWSSYWRHMRKHAEENGVLLGSRHLCNVCGRTFREKVDLKLHLLRFHSKERPYKCDIGNCTKAFIRSTLLKIHQNTVHKNLTPFQCKQCLQSFKRNECLMVHMRNQHASKLEKTCTTCGEYFNQHMNLVYHIKAHKDPGVLVCKVCDKEYKLKSSLDKHVASHRSSMECEVCGEEFSRKSYLLQHQWKHTGRCKPKIDCTEQTNP